MTSSNSVRISESNEPDHGKTKLKIEYKLLEKRTSTAN